MEQLRNAGEEDFSFVPNLNAMASARSLIINPSTNTTTILSLLETLGNFIKLRTYPRLIHHSLKLLHDLALYHPHLSPIIFDIIRKSSLLDSDSTRLATQSLALLVAVADLDRSLSPAMEETGEGFFLSLTFRPTASLRHWLLLNADRFYVRPSVLVTLLLGFTRDPYPYVRRVALDGLVSIFKTVVFEDRGLVEGCYCRAVELQRDKEDCIRSSSIRAVSEFGLKLVAFYEDNNRIDWSSSVFIQLCCMVRDMSMKVRVEVFDALGKSEIISECILLQTLSKKVLVMEKEEKCVIPYSAKMLEEQASNIAGAFVHGFEDEFYEVRRCACHSLRTLANFSAKFCGEALNMLIDVLNDDSMIVRLESLETINHIAIHNYMKVQEIHMHMFLGTLLDSSSLIRSKTRKILRSVKLPNSSAFKSCFDCLLENMSIYPEDEADIFSVLFKVGRAHGNFIHCLIRDFFPGIESSCEDQLDLDDPRVAGLVMLAISAPLSHEKPACSVPPRMFSYAAVFLGRFVRALSDIMSETTLLAYLSHCSRAEFDSSQEVSFNLVDGGISNYISDHHLGTELGEHPCQLYDEVTKSLNVLFSVIKDLWPLVQSGHIADVRRTLRSCKDGLAIYATDSLGYAGVVAFTSQYIQIVKLLSEIWKYFLPSLCSFSCHKGDINLELGYLNRSLVEIRYTFLGLRHEDELHILEMILLAEVLRLSSPEVCRSLSLSKKLSSLVSHIRLKYKQQEEFMEPSSFFLEVEKLSNKADTSRDRHLSRLKHMLDMFSLKRFAACRSVKHMKAELSVPGSDSLKPLPFISGLPVGITFEIAVWNVLCESRVWLQMRVGEKLKQFVFLDLDGHLECDGVRKFSLTAPFYRTPKAESFRLCACIVLDCGVEMVRLFKGCGGPKGEIVHLCQEKEVFLSMVNKNTI